MSWVGLVWTGADWCGAMDRSEEHRTKGALQDMLARDWHAHGDIFPWQGNIATLRRQPSSTSTIRGNGCSGFATEQVRQEGENTVPCIPDKAFFDR